MKQKELARALRGIALLGLLCVLVLGGWVAPEMGRELAAGNPEAAYLFWPCLGFIWATALPVLAALGLVWRMAGEIGRDNSFCAANARRLKILSVLAFADTAAYLAAAAVLAALRLLHVGILVLILGIAASGIAIAVVTAALSHLVYKAAVLQSENDLTI